MRSGIKGVSFGAREIKSYLCNIHLTQLHLKPETLKTPSLRDNSKCNTLTAKQMKPASNTHATKHRATDNMELYKVYKKSTERAVLA